MSGTDQDLLKEYRDKGDFENAARFLEHLTNTDRGMDRAADPRKPRKNEPSGDWQLTRSHALKALKAGKLEAHSLLSTHLQNAFEPLVEGESIEERQKRAIETFSACMDAAKGLFDIDERTSIMLADEAADHAIRIIKNEQRFPSKEEVMKLAMKSTGHKVSTGTEKTRILKSAHLTFLPKEKPERGATGHSMKSGVKEKRRR